MKASAKSSNKSKGPRLIAKIAIFLSAAAILALAFFFLRGVFSVEVEPTIIPSAAWSRDINAEGYIDGAPIGGLGAGTVTWRFDGNFYKGRLSIGRNDMDVDESCGFYMYQRPADGTASAQRLDAESLGSDQARYYSLFPKSWVDYYGSGFTCKAKVTQYSPIIPEDYRLSSYPVGIYEWELTNPTDEACEVSIMLTWKNDFGGRAVVPVADDKGPFTGIRLVNIEPGEVQTDRQQIGDTQTDKPQIGEAQVNHVQAGDVIVTDTGDCEFSIGCEKVKGTQITYASSADVDSIYGDFSNDGCLNNDTGTHKIGAICVNATLKPGQILKFPIALSWDMPVAEGFKDNDWYREYTRYFGRSGTNSWAIAREALQNAKEWEGMVDGWQAEILRNEEYPQWLKTSLFNELYYYFIGGTIWEAGAASGQADDPDEDMFGSLECFDFPFYGTSDVRFYGSWALLELWPEIEKQCVRQFCDSVYTTRGDRPEPLGTTAHDFGMTGNAFKRWNGYNYRDSRNWKDLNSKLVLMVYRNWANTGKEDMDFLDYCWIPVQKAMEKVRSQDEDGDGLPDSKGIDQTYDNMSLTGATAYCGGLYLAACEAAGEIARAMGDEELANTYDLWLEEGKASFNGRLWNGSYYNIDTDSEYPSRIMSDQLCGQWYAIACGLPGIVPESNAISSFQTIYDYNFKSFDGGANGIVNVMMPSGEVDTETSQSSECWVGTSWSVVAGMVQLGMTEQADKIGRSLYEAIWNKGQLWFRTPEAWQTNMTQVRSPYYMRATAVWAVKQAYDERSNLNMLNN